MLIEQWPASSADTTRYALFRSLEGRGYQLMVNLRDYLKIILYNSRLVRKFLCFYKRSPGLCHGVQSTYAARVSVTVFDLHTTYFVQTPAASPKMVLLALSNTSSSVSNTKIEATGPKIWIV